MEKDLTKGSPTRLILFFAIPLLLGNIFQQIYNIVDMFIVGRTLGANALAAVGCTGSVLFLIVGFSFGMTAGFSIVTAQRFGAKDERGVRKSFCASIIGSFLVGSAITIIGAVYVDEILSIMRTPPEIMEDARIYLYLLLVGVFSTIIFNLLSNTIMALGDSRTPLIFLIIACLVNTVLDYILIVPLKYGVAGAAGATVASQFLSGILCLIYIFRKQRMIFPKKEDWNELIIKDLWRSARIGLPMGFQSCIIALGCILVQMSLNDLGPVAVAAYTTANKIGMLGTAPMMSFGIAMATYVGQNYGARQIRRIWDGVKRCCLISLTFTVFISAINIFLGAYFVSFFVGKGETEVIELARMYMALTASMYWVLSLLFIFRYTLQGLGQSFVPTFAGVMELIMRMAAVYWLVGPLGFGGVCLASPLAWIGSAVPLGIAYYFSVRKLLRTIPHPAKKPVIPEELTVCCSGTRIQQ